MGSIEEIAFTDSPVVRRVEVTITVCVHEDGTTTVNSQLTPQVLVNGEFVTQPYARPPALNNLLRSTMVDLLKT